MDPFEQDGPFDDHDGNSDQVGSYMHDLCTKY